MELRADRMAARWITAASQDRDAYGNVNGGGNMYRRGGAKMYQELPAAACPRSPWEGPARGTARPPRGWRRPARGRGLWAHGVKRGSATILRGFCVRSGLFQHAALIGRPMTGK